MLVFCVPLLEVARERFDHLLDGNRMEDAYELAATLPITMREHLMQQMQHQFGLRSNGGDRGRVDTLRIPRNIPFKTLDPTQTAMWGEVFIVEEVLIVWFVIMLNTRSVNRVWLWHGGVIQRGANGLFIFTKVYHFIMAE